MTTTRTLQVPTPEEYDLKLYRIPAASMANFAIVSSESRSSDGAKTVEYVYGAGSAVDQLRLTLRRSYNVKDDKTSNSLKVSAFTKEVVTETGETNYLPLEAVIAWNHSGMIAPATDQIVTMLSIAMSILSQELTGVNGRPTTKYVDQFDHDILVKVAG